MKTTKLNLGCFDKPVEGWHNTDITPHIWISRIPVLAHFLAFLGLMTEQRLAQHKKKLFSQVHFLDVTKRFHFPDESFDFVYSSHMLEHLFPEDVKNCLSETYRLLKKGGFVRISVPDLDLIIKAYDPNAPEATLSSIFEYGTTKNRGKNSHHWMYNETLLKSKLTEVGFAEVTRRTFQEGECPDLDKLEDRPNSLFVEAIKK
jgi:predicted SAM-dependent methyltransferase